MGLDLEKMYANAHMSDKEAADILKTKPMILNY